MKKEYVGTVERPWFTVWPGHLPKNLEYPQVPAWWILERNVERFADKEAVIFVDHEDLHEIESLTYRELWQKALPVAVKQAFDRLVGKEVLIEGYGLTETSPLTHANPLDKPKAGSIGIPLPDTDCKIIDLRTGRDLPTGGEGELVIRGPQVMKGYWNKPEATAEAMAGGWFHTGDVARMDEEGYFFIIDRLRDMINSGGYKVWPREVEEVLYTHPKVCMAMVVGVPDDYYGEVVKAYIVLKDSPENITGEEVITFCRKNMAAYKAPRSVEFCDSLPISPQGKALRRLMREKEKSDCRSAEGICKSAERNRESTKSS